MTRLQQNQNTETLVYASSVLPLCKFMCVCYCVSVPQRDGGELFYLIRASQTRNALSSIGGKNNFLQCADHQIESRNIPRTMQEAELNFLCFSLKKKMK